ncbi:MAG: hypothetical protein U0103_27280 [Candidatus Obscuribacterales bacterium]|nr:hypothetical protein [Cyanobacteria bacterium SZAS LIN-5]RTL36981.1 MAG: hypothetical protein EKK48_24945 [Candidatus Melainabacteria bacterium]
MLKYLASAIAITTLLFSPIAADAQGKATKYVQPFQCTNGAGDTSSSAFLSIPGRFPLQVITDGTNGTFDNLGAVIVVPTDTPANTVSFQVIPNATLPFLDIAILGTWALPTGETGAFNSGNIANFISGNQAKNKNLQYTFNLQNFVNGFGNAPAGSTITSLFVNVEVLHSAGNKSGSVLLDNFFVNGQLIPVKIPQSAGCALPFER